ncbi:MAG: LysM peptidoglycan-binding domain-containing protein [Streptomycetaceae bacterium]|nr:LysM peptidoglycan-binding domain-containing protein [Streptomycetaceae bacterium]
MRFAPAGVAQLSSVSDLFTRPDSGAAFLLALVVVGWVGWLSFAFSVVLEIPAQLRGRAAPRLPGLGWSQQIAGALVGSILILGPTAGGALAANTSIDLSAAGPVAATAPVTVHAADVADQVSADQAEQHTYTVQQARPAQSLWSIAADQLGEGSRWQEIAHLNEGRTMVDGSVFHVSAPIQPGWVLLMPSDGPSAGQLHTDSVSTQAEHPVTVHPGDTLSKIAEEEMGDADLYPQLFAANDGRAEPGGEHLTDPDVIYPGWQLEVPAASPAADPGSTGHQGGSGSTGQHDGSGSTGAGHTGAGSTGSDSHGGGQHGGQAGATGGAATGEASPAPSATATSHQTANATATPDPAPSFTATPSAHAPSPAASRQPDAPHAQAPAQDTSESSVAYTAAVATSLSAAAVLAVIGTRRALQQRRRRPRRRIPLPQPATPIADLEKQLRVASDPVGLDLVDQALRTVASTCAKTHRPLPPLDAIRVTARGLELYLAAPTPPIAPFTELDDQPDRWWCPARGAALVDVEEARDITAPYPALVSLGETEDREAVLVNLESVGLLRLTGSSQDVRAVMLGLAVELASSALADDATIMLAGLGEELADAFPIRIEHHDQIADALPELQAHDAVQRGALTAADLDSLDEARLVSEGGDAWVPKILITPMAPAPGEAATLADLLASRPRTAACVITGSHSDLDLTGAWTLPAAAGTQVSLPGLDLSITLQRVEEAAYQPLVELLATANRTDDVPAPQWTHPPLGSPAPNGPNLVPSGGDSALAQDAYLPHEPWDDHGVEHEPYDAVPAPAEASGDHAAAGEAPIGSEGPSIIQVELDAPTGSMATALPSFSALAPTVTGATEESAAAEPTPELFDATLQEVLAERGPQPGESHGQAEDAADDNDLAALAGSTADTEEEGSGLSAAALAGPAVLQSAGPAPARPAARVTAVTSSVLAALHTPPDPPAAPQVRVLGPVDVIGTLGKVESNRRNGLTEIAAWLILHPGKSRHELDEAIWPGQRVLAGTRNTNISKLRTWLGRDPLLPANDPAAAYLPQITDGIYAFSDQVASDWSRFQALYREGMHHTGTGADIALATALALVRGRPFSDIDQSKYAWAEYDIQEMISAIVDVAHELATRRLAVRDYRAAAAAASKGLTCDQQAELLYRDLISIYNETGDRAGLERTAHQLARIAIETGADSSPETVSLINALMDANRIATA